MNEDDATKLINEKNQIIEKWFLFDREGHGIIRVVCFLVLGIFSINIFEESLQTLGKACLLYTVSLVMEYLPLFGRFPDFVEFESNRKLLKRAKISAVLFDGVLLVLCLFSLLVSCSSLLSKLTISGARWIYVILFFVIFAYLFTNCIMGMLFVAETTETQKNRIEALYDAAENGALGSVSQASTNRKE